MFKKPTTAEVARESRGDRAGRRDPGQGARKPAGGGEEAGGRGERTAKAGNEASIGMLTRPRRGAGTDKQDAG